VDGRQQHLRQPHGASLVTDKRARADA
jgi:hypothetical protein